MIIESEVVTIEQSPVKKFLPAEKTLKCTKSAKNWQILPELWFWAAENHPNLPAIRDLYHNPKVEFSYSQLANEISLFAGGLRYFGLNQKEIVSIFSENSSRWLIADQGIMLAGSANAVRSSQAPAEELIYILNHSDSKVLIVEDKATYFKLKPYLNQVPLKFVVVLWELEKGLYNEPIPVYSYEDVISVGQKAYLYELKTSKNDLATIIYTSGTTGQPKGAMLSHSNLLHQVNNLYERIQVNPENKALSILPTWHAYERSCEYFLFSLCCSIEYTNLRNFKTDLKRVNPSVLIAVPRLWAAVYEGLQVELHKASSFKRNFVNLFMEISKQYIHSKRIVQGLNIEKLNPSVFESFIALLKLCLLHPLHKIADKLIYKKIRSLMGTEFIVGVSGGGTLAKHLDDFYEIIGINILVGYGLTETSPVLTVRNYFRNIRYSVGYPISRVQIKIVHPETFKELPYGEKGLVLTKGPQVMLGYYKNQEATDKVIDKNRWFNTGDIGWLTPNNDLVLTGRAKDLIVLVNGEKVEPQPIEDACLQSPMIKQIVVVGQDEKTLGALVVPDFEYLEKNSIDVSSLEDKQLLESVKKELNKYVTERTNYLPIERICTVRLLKDAFSIENGLLTQTMKIKRAEIAKVYEKLIVDMFKHI